MGEKEHTSVHAQVMLIIIDSEAKMKIISCRPRLGYQTQNAFNDI